GRSCRRPNGQRLRHWHLSDFRHSRLKVPPEDEAESWRLRDAIRLASPDALAAAIAAHRYFIEARLSRWQCYGWAAYKRRQWWRQMQAYIPVRDGWRCGLCGGSVAKSERTIDHIHPTCRGGARYDAGNLQLAHRSCNSRKGGVWP